MRWINALIELLIRLRGGREPRWVLPPVAAEEVQEWSAEDRAELLRFLRSGTGRALLMRLRYNEALLLANACDVSQRNVEHARGRAVGYRECAASLILLSAADQAAATEQVEDFAGPALRGASELRNQLSHEG